MSSSIKKSCPDCAKECNNQCKCVCHKCTAKTCPCSRLGAKNAEPHSVVGTYRATNGKTLAKLSFSKEGKEFGPQHDEWGQVRIRPTEYAYNRDVLDKDSSSFKKWLILEFPRSRGPKSEGTKKKEGQCYKVEDPELRKKLEAHSTKGCARSRITVYLAKSPEERNPKAKKPKKDSNSDSDSNSDRDEESLEQQQSRSASSRRRGKQEQGQASDSEGEPRSRFQDYDIPMDEQEQPKEVPKEVPTDSEEEHQRPAPVFYKKANKEVIDLEEPEKEDQVSEGPAVTEEQATQIVERPEEETPSEKEETPSEKEETPLEKEETPLEKEETPLEKEETPLEKEEAPLEKEETPLEKEATPSKEVEKPLEKEDEIVTEEEKTPEGNDPIVQDQPLEQERERNEMEEDPVPVDEEEFNPRPTKKRKLAKKPAAKAKARPKSRARAPVVDASRRSSGRHTRPIERYGEEDNEL